MQLKALQSWDLDSASARKSALDAHEKKKSSDLHISSQNVADEDGGCFQGIVYLKCAAWETNSTTAYGSQYQVHEWVTPPRSEP